MTTIFNSETKQFQSSSKDQSDFIAMMKEKDDRSFDQRSVERNNNKTFFSQVFDFVASRLSLDNGPKLFDDYLEGCIPFIFCGSDDTDPYDVTDCDDGDLSLPFPLVHIEVKGKYLSIPNPDHSSDDRVWLCSMFVKEIAPYEYSYLIFAERENNTRYIVEINNKQTPHAKKSVNGILKHYLKRLSVEETGLEGKGNKIKVGSGKSKRFYKPHGIIHVAPKKLFKTVSPSQGGRMIDWTHRFAVRGHWRKVKSIGMDRDGKYCVNGMTWISSYVKGDERLPLIKKTYVVE